MAFYSWRSRNDLGRQDIHLCLEIEGECRWCEPFGIDSLGVVNRVVHYGLHSATLAIEVQKKSGLQRQVSFFVSYSMIVTMGVTWGGGGVTLGLRRSYVGVTYGLLWGFIGFNWGYIGVTLGLRRGYIGVT